MEITNTIKPMQLVPFNDIQLGEGFMVGNIVYIRTEAYKNGVIHHNAIDGLGKFHGFSEATGVKPVNITMRVTSRKNKPVTPKPLAA